MAKDIGLDDFQLPGEDSLIAVPKSRSSKTSNKREADKEPNEAKGSADGGSGDSLDVVGHDLERESEARSKRQKSRSKKPAKASKPQEERPRSSPFQIDLLRGTSTLNATVSASLHLRLKHAVRENELRGFLPANQKSALICALSSWLDENGFTEESVFGERVSGDSLEDSTSDLPQACRIIGIEAPAADRYSQINQRIPASVYLRVKRAAHEEEMRGGAHKNQSRITSVALEVWLAQHGFTEEAAFSSNQVAEARRSS